MLDVDRARLEESGLAHGAGPAALEALVAAASVRIFKRRHQIFRAGDPADVLHLVLLGRVKLTKGGSDGHEILLHFAGPGDLVGAVALLEHDRYPVTALAVEAVRTMAWPRANLAALVERTPAIAMNATRIISQRMRETQDKLREMATQRVPTRLAATLLRLAAASGRPDREGILIPIPLTRRDLAEMAGTTLFTVSRTLSEWQHAGILTATREHVIVHEPERLEAMAEEG